MEEQNVSGVVHGELPEAPGNQGGESTATEFVRASDAQRMIKEAVEAALRQSQSMTDKASARLTQQLSELRSTIDQIKASGSQVPAEMLESMRELSSSLEQPAASNSDAAGAEAEADDVDIDQRAAEIFKESGTIVYKNDPEAGMIDHSSPARFLETLQAAARAKATREGQGGGETSHLPMIGRGGQTNPISDKRDPKELYSMALGERRR